MQFPWKRFISQVFPVLFLNVLSLPCGEVVLAAQSTVQWVDQTESEIGFKIERKQGTNGTYAQIATVEANTTSYVDADLSPQTTYCYRVRAYTEDGDSPYSSEVCVTTPTQQSRLSVSLLGSGDVTSSEGGIRCPADCQEKYMAGTTVTLTPIPLEGWKLASWGGACTGQGATCVVTMSDTKNVTVKFSR